MAETKEELVQTIREWVKLDNEIIQLQKEVAIRKKDKIKRNSSHKTKINKIILINNLQMTFFINYFFINST